MKILWWIFVLFVSGIWKHNLFAQARLVFGSSATYIRLNGGTSATPVYLVIGNSAANAITHSGTGGIISEGEFNYVKWMIENATGTGYKIPWRDETSPSTEDVSVQFDITNAGNTGGFFLTSTWDGSWDNDTYKPSSNPTVANVLNTSGGNNSDKLVDRFWGLISEGSYTTKPSLSNLRFYYPDNEWNVASNSITEANLQAQRWNNSQSPNGWQGLLFGTCNATSNYVEVSSLAASDLFRWWTLTDNTSPLPVEWLDVTVLCEGESAIIKWSTASEQNVSYFTVERSLDGIHFSSIATVAAAGNSSVVQHYSVVDTDPYSGTSFYRIKETDFHGNFSYSGMVTLRECAGDDIHVYGGNGDVVITIHSSAEQHYTIEMYDVIGRKIVGQMATITEGNNHIRIVAGNLASAIYTVKVVNEKNATTQKVFIR